MATVRDLSRYLLCLYCNKKFDLEDRKPYLLPCQHNMCLPCLGTIGRHEFVCLNEACKKEYISFSSPHSLAVDKRVVDCLTTQSQDDERCSKEFHDQKKLKYFCKDCQLPACSVCVLTKCKQHTTEPLTKTYEQERQGIEGQMSKLKEVQLDLGKSVRSIEKEEVMLQNRIQDVSAAFREEGEEMIKAVECRQSVLADELNRRGNEKNKTLVKLKDKLELDIKEVENTLKIAEKAIDTESYVHFLLKKNKLQGEIAKLIKPMNADDLTMNAVDLSDIAFSPCDMACLVMDTKANDYVTGDAAQRGPQREYRMFDRNILRAVLVLSGSDVYGPDGFRLLVRGSPKNGSPIINKMIEFPDICFDKTVATVTLFE